MQRPEYIYSLYDLVAIFLLQNGNLMCSCCWQFGQDPELMAAFSDPDIMAALQDGTFVF